MAGENFCREALERRRLEAKLGRSAIHGLLYAAVEAAEAADIQAANGNLDAAQRRIVELRSDLADLVLERERQMDAEGER